MGGWGRRAVHVPPLSPFCMLSVGYDYRASETLTEPHT